MGRHFLEAHRRGGHGVFAALTAAFGLLVVPLAPPGAALPGLPLSIAAATLTPDDGAAGDQFGTSISLHGETLAVGAPGHDAAGPSAGAVYVYRRSAAGWGLEAKLTAPDAAAFDGFGRNVALDGDTVLVGANGADVVGPSSGAAYSFVRVGSEWIGQAKLVPADAAAWDLFGTDISLVGDVAVIGAPSSTLANVANRDSAYVFVRQGTSWNQAANLQPPGAFQTFGRPVARTGTTAFVSDVSGTGAQAGTGVVHVFEEVGGVWSWKERLFAADGQPVDEFGTDLAADGDTLLVGDPRHFDQAAFDNGLAYVYAREGGAWRETARLDDGSFGNRDGFGAAVAVRGDLALVGAPLNEGTLGNQPNRGAAYALARSDGEWSAPIPLVRPDLDGGGFFGSSVAAGPDAVAVGAPFRGTAGTVYVFDRLHVG